jgi:hypothetical protein
MALLSCLSYSICILGVRQMSLLFRYQEDGSNKLMHGASKSQVWFIFTCIQKSHYFYRSSTLQYLHDIQLTPCISNRTTLLYLIGELASLLVVTNAHPPLSLVCQQLPFPLLCPSHPFTPYSSSYTIYIDNINNISVVFIWDIYYLVCPTISVSWVSARWLNILFAAPVTMQYPYNVNICNWLDKVCIFWYNRRTAEYSYLEDENITISKYTYR